MFTVKFPLFCLKTFNPQNNMLKQGALFSYNNTTKTTQADPLSYREYSIEWEPANYQCSSIYVTCEAHGCVTDQQPLTVRSLGLTFPFWISFRIFPAMYIYIN